MFVRVSPINPEADLASQLASPVMSGPHDLVSLVTAYPWSNDDASKDVALAALDHGDPAWQRSRFAPGHFTASGFVASPDRSSLLLIHHPRHDKWLQPGGHLEADDHTVEEAARREVMEETGIGQLDRVGTGLLHIDAHDIPARADEPTHVHIDLGVGFVARSDAIGPVAEVLDAAWVRFGELDHFGADRAVRTGASALLAVLDPSA